MVHWRMGFRAAHRRVFGLSRNAAAEIDIAQERASALRRFGGLVCDAFGSLLLVLVAVRFLSPAATKRSCPTAKA